MSFNILKNYIKNKMRMSHIYQPVMLKSIIENNGKASSKLIAKNFLSYDPWALKYYEDIVKIIELQIKHNKPIGLGIIGPGAEPEHIEPRLEPHARSAVGAVAAMS